MVRVYLGKNALLMQRAVHEAIQAFVSEHDAMAVERYEGAQLEAAALHGIVTALPFLTTQRMVVISDISTNKTAAERLQTLLADVPDTTELLITESSPDKRTAFYKFLLKQDDVQVFEPLDESALVQWLVREAQAQQGSLSASDARYLLERVGSDQLLLMHELEKLLLYDKHVTRATIDLMTEHSPQSSVFELLDAAFSGNRKRVLGLYAEQRAQRVEPLAMLGMIAWQLHVLALVKAAGSRDPQDIAREAKLNPFVVRKTSSVAHKVSMQRIAEWVRQTLLLDMALKSQPIDADDALQHLLLSFSVQ